jgi:hypothetical protein
MPGKRVQFDDETWNTIDLLGRDRMMTFQELADEAFRDLLNKHGRPTDLLRALKRSLADSRSSSPRPTPLRKPAGRGRSTKRR